MLLRTMDTWVLLILLLLSVVQYPQPVGDAWDEVTRVRMEARARLQDREKIRLEQEVEQLALKQEVQALQNWQVRAVAGLLLLLLGLTYVWRKRSLRRQEHVGENDGANEEEVRNEDVNEEDVGNEDIGNEEDDVGNEEDDVGNEEEEGGEEEEEEGEEEEEEDNDVNGEEDNNDDGNAEEADNVAANEEGDAGNEAGNEAANANANAANNDAVANVVEDIDHDDNIGRALMERIQWPQQDLQRGCRWTTNLMDSFGIYFRRVLSNSFYPVLGRAIGVGSAFEGWSPREQDVVYEVLIPMTPPQGHSFYLEVETAGHRHLRNFRVRVQLECTCMRKQLGENMLCFLHDPEEELRSNQDPSLLHTLCTDSYLDVQKTARWFYQLVRAIWPALFQSHNWHLVLLPSRRSCQFKVTNSRESYRIEMLFGVRQGNSDIFVSSQPRQAYTSSTTWPETFAVAEMKFFKYITRQAPSDSLHLKCLQFFTRLQLGLGFSTYTMKTVVMHLLSIIPPSQWRRRHFVRRLIDISESLRVCVEVRRLNHFIVGNQRLPAGISLPPEILLTRTCNLFHDLVMDPVAHSQAMNKYVDLQQWFRRILNNEQ